ncbi:hypothetical protein RRG08_044001 [Elysia crispata]|uniref:Uncharacterized protein n=1 Tax=Elysia crispata TaxID=231223 RepID=A0AAE1CRE8_9GAST|nr:hypothetical protein RRG08_044001 [Elysia crispata]
MDLTSNNCSLALLLFCFPSPDQRQTLSGNSTCQPGAIVRIVSRVGDITRKFCPPRPLVAEAGPRQTCSTKGLAISVSVCAVVSRGRPSKPRHGDLLIRFPDFVDMPHTRGPAVGDRPPGGGGKRATLSSHRDHPDRLIEQLVCVQPIRLVAVGCFGHVLPSSLDQTTNQSRQPISLGAVGCFMFYLHLLTRQPISLGAVGCFMFYLHLLTRQPISLGAVGCFMFYLHLLTRQPIRLGAVGCFHVLPSSLLTRQPISLGAVGCFMFYLHLLTRQPISLGAVGCFMFYLHLLTRQPISLGAVGCFMFYLHLLTRQPISLGAVGCFMFYLHLLTRQPISLGAVGCFMFYLHLLTK